MGKRVQTQYDILPEEAQTPQEAAKTRYYTDLERMIKDSEGFLETMITTGEPMSEGYLRTFAAQQAKRFFDKEEFKPTKKEFNELADTWFKRTSAKTSMQSKEVQRLGKEAERQGGYVYHTDVIRNTEQENRIKAGLEWYYSPEQIKNTFLQRGNVPDEFLSEFRQFPAHLIGERGKDGEYTVKGLHPGIRKDFEEALAQPHYGAPSKEEFRTGPTGWKWAVDKGIKGITAPAEAMLGMTASRMRKIRKEMPDIYNQIYNIPIPEQDQLDSIDKYYAGPEITETQVVPPGSAPEFGRDENGRMTITNLMTKREVKDIPWATHLALAVGVPVAGGPQGLGFGGPKPESASEFSGKGRFYGIKERDYDEALRGVSVMDRLKGMKEGFTFDDNRANLENELNHVRNGYMISAKAALEGMEHDDPRWFRYYGRSQEERIKLVEEMAEEKLRAAAGGVEPDPKDLERLTIDLYQHYPVQKMYEDMVNLDARMSAVDSPGATQELHKFLFDPLWVVNHFTAPFKLAAGTTRLGAGLAIKAVGAERAAGLAKPLIDAASPLTEAVGRGAAPFIRARDGMRKLFSHWSKADDELKSIDDLLEAKASSGRSIEEMVEEMVSTRGLAGSAARAAESQGLAAGRELANLGKELDRLFDEVGSRSEMEQLGKVLSGDFDIPMGAVGSGPSTLARSPEGMRLYRHFVAEAEHAALVKKAAERTAKRTVAAAAGKKYDRAADLKAWYAEQKAATKIIVRNAQDMAAWKAAGSKGPPPKPARIPPDRPKPLTTHEQKLASAPPSRPKDALTPPQVMDLVAGEAVRTYNLPAKLASTPGKIRAVLDKMEVLVRESGQLNRIKKGMVSQAEYTNFFVPRYLMRTAEIHEAVVKAGYKDIGAAADALFPHELPKALDELRRMGFKGTDEQVIADAVSSVTQAQQRGQLGLQGIPPTAFNSMPYELRNAVMSASAASKSIPMEHWDDIQNIRGLLDDVDIVGSTSLHRVNPTTRSAKSRTKIGDLYPWINDPSIQVKAYTKALVTKLPKTAEIKHLGEAFGFKNVAGTLTDGSMMKVSRMGLGKAIRRGAVKEVLKETPFSPVMKASARPEGTVKATVERMIKAQQVDIRATKASLPPVEEGFVRLFRAPTHGAQQMKLIKPGPPAPKGKQGAYYTDRLELSDFLLQHGRKGAKLRFVDVPRNLAKNIKTQQGEYFFDIAKKVTVSAGKLVTSKTRIKEVASALSDNMGIEMVELSFSLSKKVGQTLLPLGSKVGDDMVVFAPKAIRNRFESLLPVVGPKATNEIADAARFFWNYTVKPMNAVWRPTRTLLRSPAFHAVNYFGAVGLGFLAHGVRALNPALQAGAHQAAWAAAFGGSKEAMKTKFVLPRSGYQWTIGEAIEFANKYNLIQQGQARFAMDVAAGKGPLAAYAKGLQKVAHLTQAQQVANFADDYQKFVALLGHIKDPTNIRDVYRSLDFVAEYAGNYNLLSKFERTVMRDMFTFYSWNRFILPHLVKQIVKNPNRMAAFERMRSIIEYNTKNNAPVTGMGIPSFIWMQRGFTAPEVMQPKEGEAAPGEFAMGVVENPYASMSVMAGGFYGESPVHAQLGPGGWALINMLTGFDHMSGRPWEKDLVMPGPENFDSTESFKQWLYEFNDSKVGRVAVESVPFGGAMLNILKLYGDNGMYNEQAELWMRIRAGRDFFGLDNLIARMAGVEGQSIPGAVKFGGITLPAPFIKAYAVRPLSTARKQQRRALGAAFKGEY